MSNEDIVIWHNPRCSKSRATLELLRERGIEPEIVEYLKQPPATDEIHRVLGMLETRPREFMRTGEPAYRENGLDDESVPDDRLVEAMREHPILIQRPVVIRGDRAAVGRPPENVLALLD